MSPVGRRVQLENQLLFTDPSGGWKLFRQAVEGAELVEVRLGGVGVVDGVAADIPTVGILQPLAIAAKTVLREKLLSLVIIRHCPLAVYK